MKVGEICRRGVIAVDSSVDIHAAAGDVLQAMRIGGIRRVPVVDARGALAGVVAIDDAFDVIAGYMCDITGSVKNEQRQERRAR